MSVIHFCSNKLTPTLSPTQRSSLYYRPPHRLGLISTVPGRIMNHLTRPVLAVHVDNRSSAEHRKDPSFGHRSLRCARNATGGSTGDYSGPQVVEQQSGPQPDDVSFIITEALFEEMFPYRNDRRSPARGFYTYEAFLTAARRFPAFGTTGTLEARKRELAAFFGQTSHETRGGWKDCDGGRYSWGYSHIRQVNPPSDYIVDSDKLPAAPGQKYYGRGPIQLTFNCNYGKAGKALGLDLLNDPDLVARDAVVAFSSAIWFWMTPQGNKPSCHNVILGNWTPNEADLAVNRLSGYGVLTNIINPGECGHGHDRRVASRIAFYQRYCEMLGVTPGDNLDCYEQCRF